MNKITVGKVDTNMRDAKMVDAKENKIALAGIFRMPDVLTMPVLFPRGAQQLNPKHTPVKFLRKCRTVNTSAVRAAPLVLYTIPSVNKVI